MVGMLADKVHKTMHYCDTDESMVCLTCCLNGANMLIHREK
jgi:hypothetical protein